MKNFLFLDALKILNAQGDHREERAQSQGAKLLLPLALPLVCLGLSSGTTGTSYPDSGLYTIHLALRDSSIREVL